MPLYEYQCKSCEAVNEIHHKISDPRPTECPKCHGGPLEKLISQTAFVLKGKGWYTDGYSGKSNEKKEEKKTTTDSKDAAKPAESTPKAASADAKPAKPASSDSSKSSPANKAD